MNKIKIHRYIFGLTILAGFISFSGYAKNIEFPKTTTEWVVIENSESSKAELFDCFKNIVNQEPNLYIYYDFNFKCFLYQHNNLYDTNYKTLKNKQFVLKKNIYLLEPRIITLSNSNKTYHNSLS